MALWIIIGSLLAADAVPATPDPQTSARRIDALLTARFDTEKVVPAARADDAEFFRRVNLDLIGRIPTPDEVRAFLGDLRPEKRLELIERLSTGREHSKHFARVWRALLLPEVETEPQLRYLQPGFEAWLEERRLENSGFDNLVRALLSVPIARSDELPEFVLRDLHKPNPIAFIAAKNAEPAKIASSTVRLFLCLRLECAQCHDHPFDHWTRNQFWNQAAFFAGIERRGKGPFAPLVEATDRTTIVPMDSTEAVPAVFLDLTQPQLDDRKSAPIGFAEWMTAPGNPYFARALVNRVWSQLMGTGLVEPVDDFRDTNSASQPEVLAELSQAFAGSGFDMTFLYRTICLTEAYQRTSRQTNPEQARPELFARMAIKSLSGEQFFDSLAQAIGFEQSQDRNADDDTENVLRRRVMSLFGDEGTTGDPETSVTQALALMNGSIVQRAVAPTTSRRLKGILQQFPDSLDRQIEALYLATFSRFPSANEKQLLDEFFSRGDESERARRLGDVFWMLLNSPEFRWNH